MYLCEEAARDGLPAAPVAVKRLNHSLAEVKNLSELFVRECYHWLRMGSHPNLVQALRVHYAPPDSPLLVMEYHPGSLRERLQGEPLPADTAMRLMLSIMDGLIYAAGMIEGFVHGDLKPENVLVSAEHVAKVTDLGLARSIEEGLARSSQGSTREPTVRRPEALRGTVLYMSPEQIRGEDASSSSDVYAWACIAYELMTGLPVYGRPTTNEDYERQHLSGHPSRRLQEVSPSNDVTALILSGLEKIPGNRPGIQNVRDELARIMAARGLPTNVPEPGEFDASIAYSAVQGLSQLGFYEQALGAARKLYQVLDSRKDAVVKAMTANVIATCLNELSEYEQAEALLADEELSLLTEELAEDQPGVKASLFMEKSRLLLGRAEELNKEALRMMEEAVNLLPETSAGWANLAMTRYRLLDRDGAIENLEHALVYSKRIQIFMYLIPWLTERSRHQEAINHANMNVQLHPESGAAYALRCIAALDAVLNSVAYREDILEVAVHDAQKASEYGVPGEMHADMADRLMKVSRRAIVLPDQGHAEGES